MSKKINSVVCPKCQKPLMRMVSGTSGYIFVHCDNCGSSVKIRANTESIFPPTPLAELRKPQAKERKSVLQRIIEYLYRMA